jgi:transposase-like protein
MAQFWMPFNIKANTCVDILMRQSKYLDSIVEQDHRTSKRMTWPMLGLKSSGVPVF